MVPFTALEMSQGLDLWFPGRVTEITDCADTFRPLSLGVNTLELLRTRSCFTAPDLRDSLFPPSTLCQDLFAATGCLAWNEAAYAARLSAEHAEEAVAPRGPAGR